VKRDIYEAITERFIEQLKRGTVPWQKPWFAVQNIVSRKPYRGINALLLGSTDYQSPFWISFKQALDLGGHVKKGERSTPVIYYKILEKRDEAGNMLVRENSAAYLASWIQKLESDPRMIISAASQAQRSSDFIMGIEHKESLQEYQTSPEGMPLTWAREHGIDTRIPGFAHRDQDGEGGFKPHGMEARNEAKRPAFPSTSAILVAMKSQNIPQHTFAHPRVHRANLPPSLRQGGRRVLAAPAFGNAANQRTLKDDPRPGGETPGFFFGTVAKCCPERAQLRPLLRTAGASSPWPFRHRRRRNSAKIPRIIGLCPPILSVLALPQAPSAGEKKERWHLLRPLKRSPWRPAPGLLEPPSPTDRSFFKSSRFSTLSIPAKNDFLSSATEAMFRLLSRGFS
jgi:N-terminal domain of anti-restriction factor ArdC